MVRERAIDRRRARRKRGKERDKRLNEARRLRSKGVKLENNLPIEKKKPEQKQPEKKQRVTTFETISLDGQKKTEEKKGFVEKAKEIAGGIGKVARGEDIEIGGRKIKTGLGEEAKKGKVIAGSIPIGGGAFALARGGAFGGATAISKLSTIGKVGTSKAGRVAKFSINTKTTKATVSWLSRMGKALKNPTVIAGSLVSVIGSYPFAGFIKEEALQTLSFGVKSAIQNGDLEGAQLALEQQEELLNPELWDKIKSKIPFVNVLSSLKDFYGAAETKVTIDKKILDDMRIQQETGETESDKWKRIREEEETQNKENIDYYNDQRKQMLIWEREAKVEARNNDAAFWRKERIMQRKKEEEDREAISKFWMSYRKEMQKMKENSRPSNLNFGLI